MVALKHSLALAENIVNERTSKKREFSTLLASVKCWSKMSLPVVVFKSETRKELDVKTQLNNSK